jgi:hypothetical protein
VRATLWIEYRDGGRGRIDVRCPLREMLRVWWNLGNMNHHRGRPIRTVRMHMIPPPFGEVAVCLFAAAVMIGLGAWMAIEGLGK